MPEFTRQDIGNSVVRAHANAAWRRLRRDSNWVVCSPGDPTEAQWRAMRELSGHDVYCAQRWNRHSRYVEVAIDRATLRQTDIYTIPPDGHSATFIRTEV